MDHEVNLSPPRPQTTCGASRFVDVYSVMALVLASASALLIFAMPVFAQSMPENAKPKTYGGGWECNVGYRLIEESCAAIVVPEHAYATKRAYGRGWECDHGFRESDGPACLAVSVPDGGYLGPSGQRWSCLRGFAKIDESCQKIILPANAYLVDNGFGSAWACERGFQIKDNRCVAIVIPENAFLNSSGYGQPWTCERGFFKQDGLCNPVVVPANAFLDDATYGSGWVCGRGYAVFEQTCEIIEVPENAHLDRSGNRWDCNRYFQKSNGQCVFRN